MRSKYTAAVRDDDCQRERGHLADASAPARSAILIPGPATALTVGFFLPAACLAAVRLVPGLRSLAVGFAPWISAHGRGRRDLHGRDDRSQGAGQLQRRSERGLAITARQGERSAGNLVKRGRHASPDLPGTPQLAVGHRCRGQARKVRARPEAGQGRVQQLTQTLGVGQGGVVGTNAGERSVDAETGYLNPAACGPTHRVGAQAQMREARRMRARQRRGNFRDNSRPGQRLHRADPQQIGEGVADRPLQHDIGAIPVVLDVEDLGQPGVGQSARGPRSGHHLLQSRESSGKCDNADRPGQYLVNRLPGRPPTGCGEPVL